MPDTDRSALIVFVCRSCRSALTRPLARLADQSLLSEEVGLPRIPRGWFTTSHGAREFAGDILMSLEDAEQVGEHPDSRRLIGCCGPDGGSGMNRICARGHE